MINLEFDNAVVMRQKAALESMLVSNPDTAANIRKLITQEIAKARAAISQSAKGEMATDPRQAYKAVRRSVYKSILGGQVNIFNPRGGASSSGSSFAKARKLDNHHLFFAQFTNTSNNFVLSLPSIGKIHIYPIDTSTVNR